jgi:hypothetical protein
MYCLPAGKFDLESIISVALRADRMPPPPPPPRWAPLADLYMMLSGGRGRGWVVVEVVVVVDRFVVTRDWAARTLSRRSALLVANSS